MSFRAACHAPPAAISRLRVGRIYAGRIMVIYVEDSRFRVTYEGAEFSLHARKDR